MATTITSKELKEADAKLIKTNEYNVLTLFFSHHLGKFITEFNGKFFASSKTLASPLKKFNQMAAKHNCN